MNNTISAIIPTCNRPQYLPEAIDSIRAQSLKPTEIIVANNGKEAIPEGSYGEDVQVLNLDPFIGVSAARNAGASAAKGDLLAFLDDDDVWDKDFLKHLAFAMQAEQADYVVGDKYRFYEGQQAWRAESFAESSIGTIGCFYGKNPGFGGGNFLVGKKAFFAVGGFDENITLSEDQVLPCELMLKGYKLVGEARAKYYARLHTNPRLNDKGSTKRSDNFLKYYLQFYHKMKTHMTLKQRVVYVYKGWKKVLKHKVKSVFYHS